VLEELLLRIAGKAVVKDVLQSIVPPSKSTQMPQLAIPLKGEECKGCLHSSHLKQ